MGKNFEIPQGVDQSELVRRIQDLERRIADARHLIGTTRLRLKEYLKEI